MNAFVFIIQAINPELETELLSCRSILIIWCFLAVGKTEGKKITSLIYKHC